MSDVSSFPGVPGAGAGANPRSNDPVPPAQPVDPEYAAWLAQRDTARAAAPGAPQNGEEGCPACGASYVNPAWHEHLPHCWRCGWGAARGQEYNPPVTS